MRDSGGILLGGLGLLGVTFPGMRINKLSAGVKGLPLIPLIGKT